MDLSHIARRDVFAASWAERAGITPAHLARLASKGRVRRLFHGWYSVRPWADEEDWNRLAARAAYLHFDGRAMVSHESALVWAGLPVLYSDLDVVHLTRAGLGSSRSRPPLMIHRAIVGVPLGDRVPLAHAIVQSGLTGEPLTALVAADAALHADKVCRDELDAAMQAFEGLAGIGPVRAILGNADRRVESAGETVTGHRLRQLGWAVEPQFPVETDEGTKFADFRIKGTKTLVEFDGLKKYRGEKGHEAVVEEKRREDAMRRRGFTFARFIWSEKDDLDLIQARVREQTDGRAA